MGSQFFLYNPSTKGDNNNSSLDDTILWSLWLTIWQLWNPSIMLPMVLRYGYRDQINLIQPAYRKSHLLSNTNFPYDYSGYLLSVGPTFIHSFIPLRFYSCHLLSPTQIPILEADLPSTPPTPTLIGLIKSVFHSPDHDIDSGVGVWHMWHLGTNKS